MCVLQNNSTAKTSENLFLVLGVRLKMPISKDFVLTSPYPDINIPQSKTLPDFLFDLFRKYGDKTALINAATDEKWTYLQIIDITEKLTVGLQKIGVTGGDIIGVVMSNRAEFLFLTLAALRLGAAISPSNPDYTEEELLHQFSIVKAKYFVVESNCLTNLENVIKTMRLHQHNCIVLGKGQHKTHRNYESLLHYGNIAKPADVKTISIAFLFNSSGTTGLPKSVILTHYSIIASLLQFNAKKLANGGREFDSMFSFKDDDVIYSPFPVFHVGGAIIGMLYSLSCGCTSLLLSKYQSDQFLNMVQKYRLTVAALPPPVLVMLANSPKIDNFDLSSIRAVWCGSAPVAKPIAEKIKQRLPNVKYLIQLYGMTEMTGITHAATVLKVSADRLDSTGLLLSGMVGKVVDIETGEACPSYKKGEIWLKGPQQSPGYYKNPKATRQLTVEGWQRTGDIGYYDENEHWYIVDRLKELIKVKGFQVAPAELESILLNHRAVAEVIVVGIPDDYAGELPRAFVVLKHDHTATEREIQDFVKGHVATFKELTGGVEFVDHLPKTGSGKFLRRKLRDEARIRHEMQKKAQRAKL